MLHNPASIVRLLYGERTAGEKAAEVFFSSILPTTVWHPRLPSVKAADPGVVDQFTFNIAFTTL